MRLKNCHRPSSPRAVEALKKYGKMLVTSRPEETTALLMRLCTQDAMESASGSVASSHEGSSSSLGCPPAKPADFIHLFASQPRALMLFFEYVLNSSAEPLSENILYTTLLELYLTDRLTDSDAVDPLSPNRAVWQMSPVGGRKGETPEDGSKADATSSARMDAQKSVEYGERLDKALALLKRGWPTGGEPKYDAENALVVCHLHNFKKGVVFLYERMNMYRGGSKSNPSGEP